MARLLLPAIIVLALLDGLIHLGLDLFIMPNLRNSLAILFLLSFLGYLVLVGAFLYTQRASLTQRRWVDGALIVYALILLGAWLSRGGPNPRGFGFVPLGYLSKAIEVLLILALIVHAATLGQESQPRAMATQE